MPDLPAVPPSVADPPPATGAPQWVMLGVARQLPDGRPGVLLLASVKLTHAELESELTNLEDRYDEPWMAFLPGAQYGAGWRPRYRYTVTAEMETFVMIHAATWAEAFGHLLQQWDPDRPDHPTRPGGMLPPAQAGAQVDLADDECVLTPVRSDDGEIAGWHCRRDHDHGTQP